ncbi:F-actin-capping protein subunit alpha [Tulasnella sp. 331]|nr:F-actin-capping protein subunit alpha [Tulasnella sp. 331]
MRLLAAPSRRRCTDLAYLGIVISVLSYATLHVRMRLASAPHVESRDDDKILLRTWSVNQDGKLIVPLDPQGQYAQPNASESIHSVRHPMYHLIADAERKWHDLVERQSKSLEAAVAEYQRRHRHLPPKGFDKWYAFAVKRGVVLIDEVCVWNCLRSALLQNRQLNSRVANQNLQQYDQINRDLLPFLALSPDTAQQLRDVIYEQEPIWNVKATIMNGVTELHGERHDVNGLHLFTEAFETHLPNMTWYTHVHDMSPYWIDQKLLDDAKAALLAGSYLNSDDLQRFEDPNRNPRNGVLKGCRDDAPNALRDIDLNIKATNPAQNRTSFEFIHTLQPTQDVCYNPTLFENQCIFNGAWTKDARLRPLFVNSKTLHNGGIVIPGGYDLPQIKENVTAWNKRVSKVYWRGRSTGNCPPDQLTTSPRARLHLMTRNRPSVSPEDDVLKLLNEDYHEHRGTGRLRVEKVSLKEFNAKFMDVGMVGPAIHCGDDEHCDAFTEELKLLSFSDKGSKGENNKFTIDVGKSHGNGWSARFRALLAAGSVVFKFTNFPEWNTERMMPYYHYVPIQHDFSDLYNNIAFFTGTPHGRGAHDAMAERIAANAAEYVRKHWRIADMEVYSFHDHFCELDPIFTGCNSEK